MKIAESLRKEYVVEELVSTSKQGVLEELSRSFLAGNLKCHPDAMLETLMEREKLGSTGIGNHTAIPHGRLAGLDRLIIAFGRSRQGVPFDAVDGKPVHLFFLLMAPEHSTSEHLKVLARISRMLKDRNFRADLMKAKSRDEIHQIIDEKDVQT